MEMVRSSSCGEMPCVMWSLLFYLAVFIQLHFSMSVSGNLALNRNTSQSTTLDDRNASLAVDGDNYTTSATTDLEEQWWSVNLGRMVFVSSVIIYEPGSSLTSWSVFTTTASEPVNPPSTKNGWILCNNDTQNNSAPVTYVQCGDLSLANSLVIASENGSIVLSEVEVYGLLAPVLKPLVITSCKRGYSSIEFSFKAWNGSLPEHVPVDSYNVYKRQNVTGSEFELSATVNHSSHNSTNLVVLKNLMPSTIYAVNIVCVAKSTEIGGDGSDDVVYLSTMQCRAPVLPSITAQVERYEDTTGNLTRFRIKVILTLDNIGCVFLLGFNVALTRGSDRIDAIGPTTESYVTFDNLDPYTNYTVIVEAVNSGNLSAKREQTVQTDVIEPEDAPSQFFMLPINSSCLELQWSRPLLADGPLTHFELECTFGKTSVSSNASALQDSYVLCNLPSATKVTCQLCAVNSAGKGPPAVNHSYTLIKVLDFPDPNFKGYNDARKPLIDITAAKLENAKPDAYKIIVKDENSDISRVRRQAASMLLVKDTLFNYTEAMKRNLSYYVAAEINASLVIGTYRFTIGDCERYGGYFNAPLEEGKSYTIWYAVVVSIDKDVVLEINSNGSVPFTVSAPRSTAVSSHPVNVDAQSVGLIVGPVIAVLVGIAAAILVAIGLVICVRRQRGGKRNIIQQPNRPQEDQSHSSHEPFSPNSASGELVEKRMPSVQSHSLNSDERVSNEVGERSTHLGPDDLSAQSASQESNESNPIPIGRFEWYMQTREQFIKMQFSDLLRQRNTVISPICQGTGDINLKGFNGEEKYLAKQGPTDTNIGDFRLKIRQQSRSAMIIFTNSGEDPEVGSRKDRKYHTGNQNRSKQNAFQSLFGDFTVQNEEKRSDFTITKLHRKVKRSKGEDAQIMHCHYHSWSDHHIPQEANSFLVFYHKVKDIIARKEGLVIVHGSADLDFTGMFIALDYLLDEAKESGHIHPCHCVKLMRDREPKLMLTEEQYIFLHKVLLEALITKDFTRSPSQLDERLKTHQTGGSIILQKEFELIQTLVKENNLKFETGASERNISKNQFAHIVASDEYRAKIQGDDDYYINAVVINGLMEQNSLIAAQMPFADGATDTRADFWQLVAEYSIGAVIQLEKADLEYFPASVNGCCQYNDVKLQCTKVDMQDPFKISQIKVITQKKTIYICLFEVLHDNCIEVCAAEQQDSTTPTPQLFLDLYDKVASWPDIQSNPRILVTCFDGISHCGLFVCGLNVISNYKVEQKVDVYNHVLSARLRRPEFIPTLDQYLFLYEMLKLFKGNNNQNKQKHAGSMQETRKF